MATEPHAGQEPTLVLQDDHGNYYMIPMKHMQLNLVQPDLVEDLRRQLANTQPTSETDTVSADIVSSPLPFGGSFKTVGLYNFTRDLRRRFVPPQVDQLSRSGRVPIVPAPS